MGAPESANLSGRRDNIMPTCRLLAAFLVCLAALSPANAWARQTCPASESVVQVAFERLVQKTDVPDRHDLDLTPCQTVALELSVKNTATNYASFLRFRFYNEADTEICMIAVNSGNGLAYVNYGSIPPTTSKCGSPLPGTIGPAGLPKYFLVDLNEGSTAAIRYTLTRQKISMPGYNLGGRSFADAPLLSPLPATVNARIHHGPDEGQYFRVRLAAGGTLRLSGTLRNDATMWWAMLRAHVYESPTSSYVQIMNRQVAGGSTSFTSNLFTNTSGQAKEFYLKLLGQAGWSAVMEDVQMTVTGSEGPRLTMFLDADGNFSATSPESDHPNYIPGTVHSSGQSAPLPQAVGLIAAYVNGSGAIVPPPSYATSSALFTLENTSAFKGFAMNAGSQNTPDFAVFGATPWGTDHTSRATLFCDDYGGFTRIVVSDGAAATVPVSFRIPAGEDGITLPTAGWYAGGELVGSAGLSAAEDLDAGPDQNSNLGDGFTAYEEFRGFMVSGVHLRRKPTTKDLFVHSFLDQGVGDSTELGISVWSIRFDELDGQRLVNFNYNSYGAFGHMPGHTEQKALQITDGGTPTHTPAAGENFPPTPWLDPLTPNTVQLVTVYSGNVRRSSPDHNTDTDLEDPYDNEKFYQTIAHEIGHAVSGMVNANVAGALGDVYSSLWAPPLAICPPPTEYWTVMVSAYFSYTTNLNDCSWSTIPHSYLQSERAAIRLK